MIDTTRRSRRALIASGGLSLALLAAGRSGLTSAQDADATPGPLDGPTDREELRATIEEQLARFSHVWRATSPATRLDDTYRLTVTNARDTEQSYLVVTTVMDHRAHERAVLVTEEITLAAGGSRALTATNSYGVANHFMTTVLADTGLDGDLGLLVVVEDASSVETARFTQGAFMVLTVDELRSDREGGTLRERVARRRRHRQEEGGSDHHDAAATPAAGS